jgi:hypothetical protein
MTNRADPKGRLQLVLLAAIFFGPLLFAAWLYFSGQGLQPEGRVNHGALLEPIVAIADAVPESAIFSHNIGHWLLVYSNTGDCDDACRDALYTMRQSRLMLGKEMDRVKRVFLHGDSAPDTVFLADEHQGLISLQDGALAALLDDKRPESLAAGGYFLVDPISNLVLYFPPDIEPSNMVDDLKRLLKLSRIG